MGEGCAVSELVKGSCCCASCSCSYWSQHYLCKSVFTKLCAPQGQEPCLSLSPTVSSGPSTEPSMWQATLDNSRYHLDGNLTAALGTSLDSRLGDKESLQWLQSDTYADDSVGWPNAGSRGWDGSFRRPPVLWERRKQKGEKLAVLWLGGKGETGYTHAVFQGMLAIL